ncbi:MAG: hypothetical protein SFZ24_07945 [Planctomycetota bacterium]|nr:hypothetical protein [Planctomycetota bacterium]
MKRSNLLVPAVIVSLAAAAVAMAVSASIDRRYMEPFRYDDSRVQLSAGQTDGSTYARAGGGENSARAQ